MAFTPTTQEQAEAYNLGYQMGVTGKYTYVGDTSGAYREALQLGMKEGAAEQARYGGGYVSLLYGSKAEQKRAGAETLGLTGTVAEKLKQLQLMPKTVTYSATGTSQTLYPGGVYDVKTQLYTSRTGVTQSIPQDKIPIGASIIGTPKVSTPIQSQIQPQANRQLNVIPETAMTISKFEKPKWNLKKLDPFERIAYERGRIKEYVTGKGPLETIAGPADWIASLGLGSAYFVRHPIQTVKNIPSMPKAIIEEARVDVQRRPSFFAGELIGTVLTGGGLKPAVMKTPIRTTIAKEVGKKVDVLNPFAIKAESAYFAEAKRGIVEGEIAKGLPGIKELRLKETPSQFSTPQIQKELMGKPRVITQVSPGKAPFSINPFRERMVVKITTPSFVVKEQPGSSILRSFTGGVERGFFFAPAEIATEIPQAYRYYAGLSQKTTPTLIDLLASERLAVRKGTPTITIVKEEIAQINRNVLESPITKQERAIILQDIQKVRTGKVEGLTPADAERLLKRYGGVEGLAYHRRLAMQTNIPGQIVPGVGALSGLRSEFEVIASTTGTEFVKSPVTARGKIFSSIPLVNKGDVYIRLPTGEKFEVIYAKKSPTQISKVEGITKAPSPNLDIGQNYLSSLKKQVTSESSIKQQPSVVSPSVPYRQVSSQLSDISSISKVASISNQPSDTSQISGKSVTIRMSEPISYTKKEVSYTPKQSTTPSPSIKTSIPKEVISIKKSASIASISTASKSIATPKPSIKIPVETTSSRKVEILKAFKGKQAYTLLLRRGGKFTEVGRGLTLGSGLKKGTELAKTSLAATFRLVPKGTTTAPEIKYKVPSLEFEEPSPTSRLKAPLTFIQKRGFRLGTRPEVAEIMAFKRKAPKQARRNKFFR